LSIRCKSRYRPMLNPPSNGDLIGSTVRRTYLMKSKLRCGLLVEKMNRECRELPASYVNLTDIDAVFRWRLNAAKHNLMIYGEAKPAATSRDECWKAWHLLKQSGRQARRSSN